MKSLSLFTFSLFLVLFGVRLFSGQSDRFEEFGYEEVQEEKNMSLFDMKPEEAKALLDGLDLYVEKSKQVRKVAQAKKKVDVEVKVPKSVRTLEKKYIELGEAFLAQENNMLDIKCIQDDIKRLKKDAKIEYQNSETWSAEFILMLMIQEQFTLGEVNELKGPDDLGIEMREWVKMKENSQTRDFKNKIMAFKGISENENDFDDIASLEEISSEQVEFFDDEERDSAISDFMERNMHSRNSENSDMQDLDPEEFVSDSSEEFDYSDDARRVPAALNDEDEEEIEYKNYNNGYEDEY